MDKTLSVTGTKTPAKVPSLSVPPTGLGKAPGRGLEVSVIDCLLPWLVGCWPESSRDKVNKAENQLPMPRRLSSVSCEPSKALPCCELGLAPSARSGVSSVGGGECWTNERRCRRSLSSCAVRAAKLDLALGNGRLVRCSLSASAMVRHA